MAILLKDYWDKKKKKSTEFEQFSADLSERMIGIFNQQPVISSQAGGFTFSR